MIGREGRKALIEIPMKINQISQIFLIGLRQLIERKLYSPGLSFIHSLPHST
jgi:hypothetical protein